MGVVAHVLMLLLVSSLEARALVEAAELADLHVWSSRQQGFVELLDNKIG